MGTIKKVGVYTGIAVGSLVGGTVSMIGKMTEKKVIDELGENIMDSTILTGEIVGDVASGAARVISGAVRKEPTQVCKGKKELGKAGEKVVGNVISNVKTVADQSGEILDGMKKKDKKRVAKGLRTLGKMMVVGLLTVGAIKVDEIVETEGEAVPSCNGMDTAEAEVVAATETEKQAEVVVTDAEAAGETLEITMDTLLAQKPTLEEELEEKIRF